MCLAILGKVIGLAGEGHFALTDISGVRRKINIDLLGDDIAPGEWVLIHVGFAMSKMTETHAHEPLRLLDLFGERAAVLEELSTPEAGNAY